MKLGNLTFKGRPIYYGWVIVVGMAVMEGVQMGGMLGVNFTLFVEPVSRDLGIGHAFFGWAQTARDIGLASSSFFIGWLLDRHGARWPLMVAGIIMGGAVAAMSAITGAWHMLALFLLMGFIGLQGVGGNLFVMVSVSRWFVRSRGKAMSRVFLGIPLGIFILSPLTQFLIDNIGWRSTILILGIGGGTIIFVVSLFIRKSPEDMGLLPDGGSTSRLQRSGPGPESLEPHIGTAPILPEYSWTRDQAVRSFAFWKLAIAFGFFNFAAGTLVLYRVPHFVSRGIDAQTVAFSISANALVAFLQAFPLGYALGRLQPRFLLFMSILALISAFLTTMTATMVWQVFLANSLVGLAMGSRNILENTIWPGYFGPQNVGSIRGLAVPVGMGLSLAGAPVAGMVKDATGSFLPAWWVAIVLLALSAVIFLLSPKPAISKGSRGVTF